MKLEDIAPRLARAQRAERQRLLYGRPNTTRCKRGHVWQPMVWQERTRNVTCPECGGWNQAGTIDIRHRRT